MVSYLIFGVLREYVVEGRGWRDWRRRIVEEEGLEKEKRGEKCGKSWG